jgi:hypothetical protein
MSSNETVIKRIALQIANQDAASLIPLKAEREKLVTRLAAIDCKISAAEQLLERGRAFPPAKGRDLLCPACWVRRNESIALRVVPKSAKHDIFQCPKCAGRINVAVFGNSHQPEPSLHRE